MFFKVRYVGGTVVKDNIIEVPFIILKKDVHIELARYVDNYIIEASRRKVVYNAWSTKVIKGHTRAVKRLYIMKEIYRG